MTSGLRTPRHPWSQQDLIRLRRLCQEGLDDEEIARRLGRTRRAVRTMILRRESRRLRTAPRPWSETEIQTIIRLHARGTICSVIAAALPGRTPIAVFRKLCRMVGPAPSMLAKHTARRAAKRSGPPAAAPALTIRLHPAAPPSQPVPATIEAMVRWLRSRDYIVLHKDDGWRVDHHCLSDDDALVQFVNLRRERLRLAPFLLEEAPPMPAVIAFHAGHHSRWSRGWTNR
ncbi:MAG: SANT/Myb-like DNA-binding domain-containing protein [Rhodospirillaceae bacterium]